MEAIRLIWLLALVGCLNTTTEPLDPFNGYWCPIDSLTVYKVSDSTEVLLRYMANSQVGEYRLHFNGKGLVISTGEYTGQALIGLDTIPYTFSLPLANVRGAYEQKDIYLRFNWPWPEAGPSWFWEVARHPITARGWETEFDYLVPSQNLAIYSRIYWEPCHV